MKESIIIKNVGPLKNIEINGIKPLTVFIGKSATGKSTIMKIVGLMRYIYKMVNIRSYLKNANIIRSPFKLRFNSLLHDGLENMIDADSEIHYSVEINNHTYTISYSSSKLNANISIPNEDLIFTKESYIAETRSVIPAWIAKSSSLKGANLGFYFHETLSDFNEATDQIKEQNLEYMNLKMRVQKSANKSKLLLVDPLDGGKPYELKHASSGIQTSAPLVSIVNYFAKEFSFKDAFQRSVLSYLYEQDRLTMFKPEMGQNELEKHIFVHIEEAELSLDPEAQRALVSTLIDIAFHKNNPDRKLGLMFATHSPYIINHLNVLLRASYFEQARKDYPYLEEDNVAVYRLEDGGLTSLMSADNDTNESVINTYDLSDTMERIFNEYEGMEVER